ncbi:MAG TPA: hypothetical protein VII57_08450 [Dehalococcoidia bacterium]
MRALVAIALILGALALASLGCGGDAQPKTAETAKQSDDQGGITLQVTWNGELESPSFDVVMDTHSVDLDAYDLGQLAVLRTNAEAELAPVGWDAPEGGHHRQGTLRFASLSSRAVNAGYIELVIRDVSGVPERRFRWQVN